MPEKIIIDIDDIHEEPKDSGERIVVEIPEDMKKPEPKIEIDALEESYEAKIRNSKPDFYYKGNSGLCSYYESPLRFPEGIDRSFGLKFRMQINDEFLSSLLVNNLHVIAASRSGCVYFADRFDGVFCDKINFPGETFEKTGTVHSNTVYVNSPAKIFRINDQNGLMHDEVYASGQGTYIWSSLNRKGSHLIFTEHSPAERTGRITALDINTGNAISSPDIRDFAGEQICCHGSYAFSVYRNKLAVMNTDTLAGTVHELNIDCGEAPFVFAMNNRLYATTHSNELYYLDLPAANYMFRNTGIRNTFMNSAAGFADNIFIGTQEGWKCYKSSGLEIFSFEDEYENRIESVNRSLLIISQKNKIVFGNLNRFQEAESFVISAAESMFNTEIISAVISHNDIYTLTSNGILSAFTNDKMNIHI